MAIDIRTDDALVVIDVQHDFLPGGARSVRGRTHLRADQTLLVLGFGRVYARRDWHPADHSSFARPAVRGRCTVWRIRMAPRSTSASIGVVIDKGTDVATDGYSGFAATPLERDLREHGIKRVFVAGLSTDYCVKATALDGKAASFDVVVLADAATAVNVAPGDEERAPQELRDANVAVTVSTALSGNARPLAC
jgi:nicotinamidase/pyrazinamidase